ncbi:hypothetical protein [Pelagicoccus mobilis]|uniref:Uncharacterized protein n=1 Tax=Pelagicoccus mobilis TaxID=415221 RepID=A0A934RTD4_9BACT|nr:hypothetical protein [Pelagicoccus mobilis]MBK1876088.1 hypothetical protein [Pelagicoccus mobilis]
MIIKQCQYQVRPKGPADKSPALLTVGQVKALLDYLKNPSHRNHAHVEIGPLKMQHCLYKEFPRLVDAQSRIYQNVKVDGNRPGSWDGEIAEHVVVCPHPEARLDEEERSKVVREVFQTLAEGAPAVAVWHLGTGANIRDELHVVMSYFRPRRSELMLGKKTLRDVLGRRRFKNRDGIEFPVGLRVTNVKNTVNTNYRTAMLNLSQRLVSELNFERANRGIENPLPTIKEIRERAKRFRSDLVRRIWKELGTFASYLDPESLKKRLERKNWSVKIDGKVQSFTMDRSFEPSSKIDGVRAKGKAAQQSVPAFEGPPGIWVEISPPLKPEKKEKKAPKPIIFRYEHLLVSLWYEKERADEKAAAIAKRLEADRQKREKELLQRERLESIRQALKDVSAARSKPRDLSRE